MNSAYEDDATYDPIIRDIECRRDTEAETFPACAASCPSIGVLGAGECEATCPAKFPATSTDYDSGDVGGTEDAQVCLTCSGKGLDRRGIWHCPTCHGTGVAK